MGNIHASVPPLPNNGVVTQHKRVAILMMNACLVRRQKSLAVLGIIFGVVKVDSNVGKIQGNVLLLDAMPKMLSSEK